MRAGRSLVAAVLMVVLTGGSAVALQITRDRLYPRGDLPPPAFMYLSSGEALRRIVLSFDALAADVYWIRTLQHYGGNRLSRDEGPKYELLYPLLDLTTSLDPYFTIAYRFGAIFLSEPPPGGPGRPDQAVALLQKGISVEPTKWQYYHDIAFVHYWQKRDLHGAAEWFRRAASQPDAPEWLEPVAASMLLKGGDRASARFLLHQILQSEEPWLRRMAHRGLLQVDALDAIDELQPLVLRASEAGQPYSWERLIRRGLLRGVPVDPTGTPYALDPETGVMSVSAESELYPMPTRTEP